MPAATRPLYVEARDALHLLQSDLVKRLGLSRRTGQRWDARESSPSFLDYQKLAAMVFPVDVELAQRLAAAGGSSLQALGLVVPAPPAPETDRPAAARPSDRVVDAIVCAAAEAMNVVPQAIRPALLAAFACAVELGLTVEQVERVLAGTRPSPASLKAAERARPAKKRA